jgi:hypothetical protein
VHHRIFLNVCRGYHPPAARPHPLYSHAICQQ